MQLKNNEKYINNELKILPTIISRLKLIYIKDNNQIKLDKNKDKLLERILINKQLKLIPIDEVNFQDLLIYFRKKLKSESSKKIIKILKEIIKTINLVENNNLNKQLALDNLLIMIYKEFNNNENGKGRFTSNVIIFFVYFSFPYYFIHGYFTESLCFRYL